MSEMVTWQQIAKTKEKRKSAKGRPEAVYVVGMSPSYHGENLPELDKPLRKAVAAWAEFPHRMGRMTPEAVASNVRYYMGLPAGSRTPSTPDIVRQAVSINAVKLDLTPQGTILQLLLGDG